MNKVDFTKLGGDPFTLDNLEFFQDGLIEAIKGLCAVWRFGTSDDVILAGLNGTVSGSNTIYPNGYIVVGDEIYFVQGGTFLTTDPVVIDISQTFDSGGDETFEDLTNQQTHIVRRGILKVSTGGPNEIDMADLISVRDRLSSLGALIDNSTAWQNVGTAVPFNSTWTNVTSGTFSGSVLRYKKTKTGEVVIDGSAIIPVSGTVHKIFTLPAGFRPLQAKRYSIVGNNNSVNAAWDLIILANGEVQVFNMDSYDNTLSLQVALDNIRFFLD